MSHQASMKEYQSYDNEDKRDPNDSVPAEERMKLLQEENKLLRHSLEQVHRHQEEEDRRRQRERRTEVRRSDMMLVLGKISAIDKESQSHAFCTLVEAVNVLCSALLNQHDPFEF